MADTATTKIITEIDPAGERKKLLSQGSAQRETVDSELSIDYVYSQKFSIKNLKKFKEALFKRHDHYDTEDRDRGYAGDMLNYNQDASFGDVFFKVQLYYDVNPENGETCIMNFHLFSIESINEGNKRKIQEFVNHYFHQPNIAQLVSTEILLRSDTHLRKPVVP